MGIDSKDQMDHALREAIDGTVTLDGILNALGPFRSVMGAMNELFRDMPSGAVLLLLSTFTGTIAYDDELRIPEIPVEDRLELFRRHAMIAYQHLVMVTETDPRMQEFAIQRGMQTEPTPKERRSAFQLLQGNKGA